MLWHGDEPRHYGDFVGRPEVLNTLRQIGQGKKVLDLGCGEGYLSRKASDIAAKVIGIDNSERMITLAKNREKQEKRGIEYLVGDVTSLPFQEAEFDVCVGCHITNYIHPDKLPLFYQGVSKVLVSDGQFILLMPHPALILCTDYGEALDYGLPEFDYFGSRGKFYTATAKTAQGTTLEVGLYHSTFEDHLNAIASANLRVHKVEPLVFSMEIAGKYPIFSKMGGKVANIIILGGK